MHAAICWCTLVVSCGVWCLVPLPPQPTSLFVDCVSLLCKCRMSGLPVAGTAAYLAGRIPTYRYYALELYTSVFGRGLGSGVAAWRHGAGAISV
jgi:hypothetical protein